MNTRDPANTLTGQTMSDDSGQTLVPIEERIVEFYGDEIKGVRVTRSPSGYSEFYVPLRQLCDYLGVSYTGQRERINRDAVLSKKLETIQITTAGGPQDMQCLHLDYLNGWLFGINANRVKEAIRERVIRYQEECYVILRDAFQGSASPDALTQVEQLGQALITLAREQREFDLRLDITEDRVDQAAVVVGELTRRVTGIEKRLTPGEAVTEEQASQISQSVKAVAIKMAEKSGRNEFGGVYGELYRKFGITSYKMLPVGRFEEAIEFLTEWYGSLTGDEPF
jgi:hypothetical protein